MAARPMDDGRAADALAPHEPRHRKMESGAAWTTVAVAWCAAFLGLVGPHLGGQGPGLQGPVGYAVEVVTAMWLPGGALTALLAVALLLRRSRAPTLALAPVALLIVVPAAWARLLPPASRAVAGSPTLRLATVNLDADNVDDPSMRDSLHELDADVLVLTEFTRSWAERLQRWFPDDYPHRWLAAAPEQPGLHIDGLRIAVWSRLPPAGEHEELYLRQCNAQIRVPLRWHQRSFVLYGIHPWKPYPYAFYHGAWRERQQLLDWLRNERRPTVVAGDFNASPRSAFLVRLRQLGLFNAAEAVLGYAPTTWPMRADARTPIPIAIDHVMHSDAFLAVGARSGPVTKSDHAPLVVELRWRDE